MSKLIYADESLKRINEIMPRTTDSDYKKGIAVGMSMAKIAINEQEGADAVQVVHGYWIDKLHPILKRVMPYCSVCGISTASITNYCPCCGAKMDEVAE